MIIGLLAGKGNVGRTTLARSLAEFAAKERGGCSLYELDVCNPKLFSLYPWTGSLIKRRVSRVDSERCKMAEKCIDACKFGAIIKADDRIGRRAGICRGCGMCKEVCPEGAIDWDEIPSGEIGRSEHGELVMVGGRLAQEDDWEGFLIRKVQEEFPMEDNPNSLVKAPLGLGATALRAVKQAEALILVTTAHEGLEREVSTFGQIVQGFGVPGGVVFQGKELPSSLAEGVSGFGLSSFLVPGLEDLGDELLQDRDPELAEVFKNIWDLGGGY